MIESFHFPPMKLIAFCKWHCSVHETGMGNRLSVSFLNPSFSCLLIKISAIDAISPYKYYFSRCANKNKDFFNSVKIWEEQSLMSQNDQPCKGKWLQFRIYLTHGVESIVRVAIKSTLKNPKESGLYDALRSGEQRSLPNKVPYWPLLGGVVCQNIVCKIGKGLPPAESRKASPFNFMDFEKNNKVPHGWKEGKKFFTVGIHKAWRFPLLRSRADCPDGRRHHKRTGQGKGYPHVLRFP